MAKSKLITTLEREIKDTEAINHSLLKSLEEEQKKNVALSQKLFITNRINQARDEASEIKKSFFEELIKEHGEERVNSTSHGEIQAALKYYVNGVNFQKRKNLAMPADDQQAGAES